MNATASASTGRHEAEQTIALILCHFHVTRGNEIACTYPADAHCDGVEWKTLPSGGHLVSSDVITFEPPVPSASSSSSTSATSRPSNPAHGLAVFRNVLLQPAGIADSAATTSASTGSRSTGAAQRGARMFSASALLTSSDQKYSHRLAQRRLRACALDHLHALAQTVADELRAEPELDLGAAGSSQPPAVVRDALARTHARVRDALAGVAADDEQNDQQSEAASSDRSQCKLLRRWARADDCLAALPSQHAGLGPVLPKLLKALLPAFIVPAHPDAPGARAPRLLIFAPNDSQAQLRGHAPSGGAAPPALAEGKLQAACALGCNLLELLAGLSARHARSSQRRASTPASERMRMRGVVSVHDLGSLEAEARAEPGRLPPAGWVAVTSDALLREKMGLFDYLLDLSPASSSSDSGSSSAAFAVSASSSASSLALSLPQAPSNALPRLYASPARGARDRKLVHLAWTARESSAWDAVDRAAEAELARSTAREGAGHERTTSSGASTSAHAQDQEDDESSTRMPGAFAHGADASARRNGGATLSDLPPPHMLGTLLTFLRFCFAGWPTITALLTLAWRRQGGLTLGSDSGMRPAISDADRRAQARASTTSEDRPLLGDTAAAVALDDSGAAAALHLHDAWTQWSESVLSDIRGDVLPSAVTSGAGGTAVIKAAAMRRAGLSARNELDTGLVRATAAVNPKPAVALEFQTDWRGFFS